MVGSVVLLVWIALLDGSTTGKVQVRGLRIVRVRRVYVEPSPPGWVLLRVMTANQEVTHLIED